MLIQKFIFACSLAKCMNLGLVLTLLSLAPGMDASALGLSVGEGEAKSVAKTDAFKRQRHEQGREIYNFRCYFCQHLPDAKTEKFQGAGSQIAEPRNDDRECYRGQGRYGHEAFFSNPESS